MHEALFSRGGLSLERLRTLCEVASRGGIAKAAGGDPVRQSQFSRQLRELETFFDVELTRRRGRNAELTAAGRELATLSRELLDALAEFAQRQGGGESTLRIGAGESLLQWSVLPRLGGLRAALPNTVFSFRNLRGDDAITQLVEAEIDFALIAERELPEGINAVRLGVLRYGLFVSGRMGGETKPAWQDVLHRPLVGLEGDGRQMRALQAEAERAGFQLKPSVLCASLPSVAQVLAQHEGFAVLPDAAAVSGLVRVDAPFLAKLQRTILLAWNERRLGTRGLMPKWRRVLMGELKWR